MEWKRISSDAHIWDKAGKELEGVYLGFEENEQWDNKQHLIETNLGIEKFWGTAILDIRLKNVIPGMMVKVVYLGLAQTDSKRSYHNFEVFYQKVSGVEQVDSDKDESESPQ